MDSRALTDPGSGTWYSPLLQNRLNDLAEQNCALASSCLLERTTSKSDPPSVTGGSFAIWMQNSCRD